MRTEGYLDWQILLIISNQVMNYRVHLTEPTFHPERSKDLSIEFMNREELDTDPYFPEESLYDPQYSQSVFSSLIATTSTWDLQMRRNTPDIQAIKKLMDVRYFQSSDDILHEDIFAPLIS